MAHGDITHVEIPVADFAQATTLYADLFGWKISEMPEFAGYPMWQAPNGVSGGAIVRPEDAAQPLSYVEVDSIDDTLAKVTAAGGSVDTPKTAITPTSWSAVLLDPFGNRIGLFEGAM